MIEDSTLLVPLTDISPNPWNPHDMTEDEQNELEASVLDSGQWRPILVIHMDEPDEETPEITTKYRIVDGEHLYRALCSLHLAGKHTGMAKVMVYGDNSEIPAWKQMEIGQTINHGMRGSIEDAQKTNRILKSIMNHRPAELVARRVGLSAEGLEFLTKAPKRTLPGTKAGPPKLIGAVSGIHEERKAYHLALVFPTAEELQDFEELLTQAGEDQDILKETYPNRMGTFRIDVIRAALEAVTTGSD